MSTSANQARLQLAPGTGRLARRDAALLFVPQASSSEEVIALFMHEPNAAAAAQKVKDFVVDQNFVAPALVLVQWHDETVVTVFGAAEAQTSSRTAPLLSGASSTGLVEHRPAITDGFHVHAGDTDQVDSTTELGAGSVFASGFSLLLHHAATTAPATTTAPAASAEIAAPEPDPTTTLPADQMAAIASAAQESAAPEADTLPLPDPAPPEVAPGGPLVEARVCSCGAANPPTEGTCRACGTSLADTPVTVITRPCVALLELPDGLVIDVDTNLSIGRSPNPPPGFEAVDVDLPGVSRHHVDIVLDGWDILITDRSSKNGVMVLGEDGAAQPIEPEQSWLIRLGSTLYLGTNEVRVVHPSEDSF